MIQIVGLLVAAYVFARCIAEATSKADGTISLVGRIGYALCFLAALYLTYALFNSGTPTAR